MQYLHLGSLQKYPCEVYTLNPTDTTTLVISYPTDLAIVLTTYLTNLATLLITYPTNLTIRFRVETHKLINKFFTNV